MTPIQAAIKAYADAEQHVNQDGLRDAILAFLDAAAGDDAVLMAAQKKGEHLAGDRVPGALRMAMGDLATQGAQAAILALKEAVNG